MAKAAPAPPQEETEPKSDEAARRAALLEGQEPETEAAETPEPEAEETQQTPPEPEGEQTQEQEEAEKTPTFIDQLRQMGWQGEDEQEGAMALLQSYQQAMQERQAMQQRYEEMEELARLGREHLKAQQAAQPKEEPQPQTPDPWWNPPTFDPHWIEQYRDVQISDDGQPQLGWKANTPREVREAADSYQQYLEQWATDLVQRPQEVLPKVIEQEFDRLFEERIAQREQSEHMSDFAERVREANRDWMYTQDSQGREVLTEQGRVMTNLLGEVAEAGVTNPELQWQFAVAMYDQLNRSREDAEAQKTTQAQQTAAQKRRQQLERGAGQNTHNRTGTVPRPDEEPNRPQNAHLTPGQQLVQQLRQDGAEFV